MRAPFPQRMELLRRAALFADAEKALKEHSAPRPTGPPIGSSTSNDSRPPERPKALRAPDAVVLVRSSDGT